MLWGIAAVLSVLFNVLIDYDNDYLMHELVKAILKFLLTYNASNYLRYGVITLYGDKNHDII
jgi:hypothetical protein